MQHPVSKVQIHCFKLAEVLANSAGVQLLGKPKRVHHTWPGAAMAECMGNIMAAFNKDTILKFVGDIDVGIH